MKRTEKHRPERMSELIRHSIADAIATELKDPRVGFVTVEQWLRIWGDEKVYRARR